MSNTTEIDAEFSESEIEPENFFDRLLEFINTLESDWRSSNNLYLAQAAANFSEAIHLHLQENNQSFIPEPKPAKNAN